MSRLRYGMMDLLPGTAETKQESHIYVSCSRWIGDRAVAVNADGHTDYPSSHDFNYSFTFDVAGKVMIRNNPPPPR